MCGSMKGAAKAKAARLSFWHVLREGYGQASKGAKESLRGLQATLQSAHPRVWEGML